MNKIIELQKKCDELSVSICNLCKPLMLNKELKQSITQLLSSEGDLRLAIELSLEVETKQEFFEKIGIAKEEAEIILYCLMQLEKAQVDGISNIKKETEEIINLLGVL